MDAKEILQPKIMMIALGVTVILGSIYGMMNGALSFSRTRYLTLTLWRRASKTSLLTSALVATIAKSRSFLIASKVNVYSTVPI